jgi:hypothetical protein
LGNSEQDKLPYSDHDLVGEFIIWVDHDFWQREVEMSTSGPFHGPGIHCDIWDEPYALVFGE